MSPFDVAGVALITGAGSGIGRETAFAFAEYGAKAVIFADVNEDAAKKAAAESEAFAADSDYSADVIQVDTAIAASVDKMVATAVQKYGRIDYNVNCAGAGNKRVAPVTDFDVDMYDEMQNINLRGVIFCMRAVMKVMEQQSPSTMKCRSGRIRELGRGAIVNLCSAMSLIGVPGSLQYVVAKHGLLGATKVAALEGGKNGIRVNACCPAQIEGPMMENVFNRTPELRQTLRQMIPLGRIGEPDEVADTNVFLCSPAASFVNGAVLLLDGGVCLTAHAV